MTDQTGWSVMKTRQGNNVTNRINVAYAKNKIGLSWPIGSGAV